MCLWVWNIFYNLIIIKKGRQENFFFSIWSQCTFFFDFIVKGMNWEINYFYTCAYKKKKKKHSRFVLFKMMKLCTEAKVKY